MAKEPIGFRVKSLIVCDDVREEKSGKDVAVGIYNRSMVVPSIPVRLPFIVFRLVFEFDRKFETIEFFVKSPSKKKLFEFSGPINIVDMNEWIRIAIKIGEPVFEEAGEYVVWVGLGGRRRRVGEILLRTPTETEAERLGVG